MTLFQAISSHWVLHFHAVGLCPSYPCMRDKPNLFSIRDRQRNSKALNKIAPFFRQANLSLSLLCRALVRIIRLLHFRHRFVE